MGLLSGIGWALDRPQQALFHGAKRGSQSFEDDLHRNRGVLSSIAGSVPSFARGAYEGFTGQSKDVRGSDLVEGLEQHLPMNQRNPEWNKPLVEALGNYMDVTASPGDAIGVGAKALKVPWNAYKQIGRMTPEYAKVANRLGSPSGYIKNAAQGMMNKAQGAFQGMPQWEGARAMSRKLYPERTWKDTLNRNLDQFMGKYGVYMNAPSTTEHINPMIIRSGSKDISPLLETLTKGENKRIPGQILEGVYSPLSGMPGFKPEQHGNLIMSGMGTAGINPIRHEGAHYIDNLISAGPTQLGGHITQAQNDFTRRMPLAFQQGIADMGGGTRENSALAFKVAKGALAAGNPEMTTKLSKLGYSKSQMGGEILADLASGHYKPENPGLLGEALRGMVEEGPYIQKEAWTPLDELIQGMERAPTHVAAQARRSGRGMWEE
jgi:hypothetical protein